MHGMARSRPSGVPDPGLHVWAISRDSCFCGFHFRGTFPKRPPSSSYYLYILCNIDSNSANSEAWFPAPTGKKQLSNPWQVSLVGKPLPPPPRDCCVDEIRPGSRARRRVRARRARRAQAPCPAEYPHVSPEPAQSVSREGRRHVSGTRPGRQWRREDASSKRPRWARWLCRGQCAE